MAVSFSVSLSPFAVNMELWLDIVTHEKHPGPPGLYSV